MKNLYKLSFIIPCFNEEKNLLIVVQDIIESSGNLNYKIEILIVDDGSKDDTYTLALNLKDKYENISVIKHVQNKGFGAAFWTGVLHANGEYLVLVPGDGECNIKDIISGTVLLDLVDLVIPFVYNKNNRSASRRIISYMFTQLINLTFMTRLNYTNGAVIYRTSILKKLNLKSLGFFFQTEILMRLVKSGYLYAEIPVFLNKRSTGTSKALSPKSLVFVIRDFLNTILGIYVTKNYLISIETESVTSKRNSVKN
jgi:glycosyltransferase involved in cell wall biosynthesis